MMNLIRLSFFSIAFYIFLEVERTRVEQFWSLITGHIVYRLRPPYKHGFQSSLDILTKKRLICLFDEMLFCFHLIMVVCLPGNEGC